jgi:hypothetical protein
MSATAVFLMSCGSPEFRFPDEWNDHARAYVGGRR